MSLSFNPRAREGRDRSSRTAAWRERLRFNPRAREGRDTPRAVRVSGCACFNPRAREGRDMRRTNSRAKLTGFNPRAREGRDFFAGCLTPGCLQFQSTRPRGARPCRRMATSCMDTSFNPRAREGRDKTTVFDSAHTFSVSIHAPARGATTRRGCMNGREVFQSTRPRGARRL